MILRHPLSVPLLPADAMTALKLRTVVNELCAKNDCFSVSTGADGEIVLHSVGELELEMVIDSWRRRDGLDFKVGAPQVRYLERITKAVEWDYTHKKQTGGRGEYAKVRIRLEPTEPGGGFVFESAVRQGTIPEAFIPAVEKGLETAKETGTIAGFPVTDLKCTLLDGGYHDIDSSERTFEVAARACFREALPKAGPRVFEPMMIVMVLTPQDYLGEVVGDLNSRRGQVQGMEPRGPMQEIIAVVPLGNMFGSFLTLRSKTRAAVQYMMTYSHYEQVPPAYRGPDDDTFPPAVGMRA
jgi:elongation factor G